MKTCYISPIRVKIEQCLFSVVLHTEFHQLKAQSSALIAQSSIVNKLRAIKDRTVITDRQFS